MKTPSAFALLSVFLALPVSAQINIGVAPSTPINFDQRVYGVGAGFNSSAAREFHGIAFYAEKVNDSGLFSYSRFDLVAGQTLTTTGLSQAIASALNNRIVCVASGTAGVSSTGENFGNAFTGGGDCFFRVNKGTSPTGGNNYISFGGELVKNSVGTQTGFNLRITFSHGEPKKASIDNN